MRAVLLIFSADRFLLEVIKPHVDCASDSIDWDQIWQIRLCAGHKAAVAFAYGLWTDQLRPKIDLFDMALSMGPGLKRACLEALALRWGLSA